jgi:hypothetical protein
MTSVPSACIGEPVSWLRLERFHLGELGADERAHVAEHLAACAACAACAARVEADEALDLPPLGLPPLDTRGRVARPRRRGTFLARAGGLAIAAIAVLAVGKWRARDHLDSGLREGTRPKGDGMAFVLVRDDGQRVVDAQGVFRPGDRFKALVTCPPSASASFDLVVFDADGASFPLAPVRGLSCGNEVPLPGAFLLSMPASAGGETHGEAVETVCVVWADDGAVDREALSRSGRADGHAMCKRLQPAAE